MHTHFIIDSSAGDQTLVSLWFGKDFPMGFPMATWYDRTQTNPWCIARVGIAVVYSMVSFGDEYETIHLKLICEELLPPLSIPQNPATLFVVS